MVGWMCPFHRASFLCPPSNPLGSTKGQQPPDGYLSVRLLFSTAEVGLLPQMVLPPSHLLLAAQFWALCCPPQPPCPPQCGLCPSLQILAALPYDWRGTHLLVYSCLRVVFIPLFIMCVYPNGSPTFGHPAWPCIFSLLMGITNGYFGSVPMILAAGKVSPEQRELAGRTKPSWESHTGWPERPDTPHPFPQGTP